MLLFAFSQGPDFESAGGIQKVVEAWEGAHLGIQIAAIAVPSLILLTLVVLSLRALGRRFENGVLIGLAVLFGLLTLGFGAWAVSLPEVRGSRFVLSHQVIRVICVLSAVGFSGCVMGLLVPRVLNLLERGGIVSYIAARHVRSKKSGFLTAISFLSIFGVALSSFALCAVISIMGGFGADLKKKILGNTAHIRIESEAPGGFEYWREVLDEARLVPGVKAATPVAAGEVMASSSTNTAGLILQGVDTATIGEVIDVPQHMEVGSFRYLDDPVALRNLPADAPIGIGPTGDVYLKGPDRSLKTEPEDPNVVPDDAYPGLVLGRELAKSLHVYVGDAVTLVSPLGELGPMGILPRTTKFRIAGIFYTGMYEYDASHAYVKLEESQKFLDLKHFVTDVELRVERVEAVGGVTQAVREAIKRDDLRVRDWQEMNKNLFSALQLEKIATFVILSIAIAVASFCIICTLLLMVTEKSKEIAILKAMGSSDRMVLRTFITEGMFIGGVGTVFGVVTGFIAMYGLEVLEVRLDPAVYYVDRLPIEVNLPEYLAVALCAFAITTLATLYPASAASRLRPVDGIRYE